MIVLKLDSKQMHWSFFYLSFLSINSKQEKGGGKY